MRNGLFCPRFIFLQIITAAFLLDIDEPYEPVILQDLLAFFVKGKKASEKKSKYDVFEVLGAYGGPNALPKLSDLGY